MFSAVVDLFIRTLLFIFFFNHCMYYNGFKSKFVNIMLNCLHLSTYPNHKPNIRNPSAKVHAVIAWIRLLFNFIFLKSYRNKVQRYLPNRQSLNTFLYTLNHFLITLHKRAGFQNRRTSSLLKMIRQLPSLITLSSGKYLYRNHILL